MTPRFHPAARRELEAAMLVGEERAPGLGQDLLREVRRVLALLGDAPLIGEPIDQRLRRFPLTRFPYAVVYRVEGDILLVLSLAHRRQKPGFWGGRK